MSTYYITVDDDTLELLMKSITNTKSYWETAVTQMVIDADYGKIKIAQYQALRDSIESEIRNQK